MIEKRLIDHGVRPTAVRNMLLSALSAHHGPVSAQELEIELDTVDRSTISRSLATFAEAGLLHIIDDGTGIPKYECCPSERHHTAADGLVFRGVEPDPELVQAAETAGIPWIRIDSDGPHAAELDEFYKSLTAKKK